MYNMLTGLLFSVLNVLLISDNGFGCANANRSGTFLLDIYILTMTLTDLGYLLVQSCINIAVSYLSLYL
jgi:hypothetical protein